MPSDLLETCPPCLDSDHATVEDGICTCCGAEVPVECGICPGPGCCCDDIFDAWRERDL